MSEDRKKPVWPWVAALLIGLPVLYFLSVGPVIWADERFLLPGMLRAAIGVYLLPTEFVYENGPAAVQGVMNDYLGLFEE